MEVVEKLSDSEKLVLRLQNDIQFVLKDKVSLFCYSGFSEKCLRVVGYSQGSACLPRDPDMLMCTRFSLSAGASEHGAPGPRRAVHSHPERI